MDTNLVFTFVSPTVKEATGYEPEEMIGRCMLNYLTDDSKRQLSGHINLLMPKRFRNKLDKIVIYDVQFICKDSSVIWFEVSVKPVFEYQCFSGYIGSSRDISDKKKYELELKKYIEELKKANEKLDELANEDILTGAYNRRKFENFINLFIAEEERTHYPFSIIMFDIDSYKKINDYYGHKTGDRILSEVTAIVREMLDDKDKLFRWGGDEFIVLMTGTTVADAYTFAEKIRKAVETTDFQTKHDSVTVSLGVCEHIKDENIDWLVTRVDDNLMKAKSLGKNTTVM
jgi:diguanylate cyclase (GGDEF)-like protein/PAS domain S-box-containing protein